MKKNKWFVLAALIGLLLSVSFVVVGCGNVQDWGKGCDPDPDLWNCDFCS